MTDRDALFSAILANPDDDLARLVYTDALEETGAPVAVARARFIRLQVELARCTPETSPEHVAELTHETEALAARWGRRWLAELPSQVATAIREERRGAAAFRRGFADGMTLSTGTFIWTANDLFGATPLTALHLYGGLNDVRKVLMNSYARRLRALKLSGGWQGDLFAYRCGGFRSTALRELDLSGCRLTDTGARAVSRMWIFSELSVLRVRDNLLTEDGIVCLASAMKRENAVLDVTGNPGSRLWTDAIRPLYRVRLVF